MSKLYRVYVIDRPAFPDWLGEWDRKEWAEAEAAEHNNEHELSWVEEINED